MPTQLTQMQRQSGSMDGVMRALVDEASQEIVASVLPMFTEAFKTMIERLNAQIVVNSPAVSVAAPTVSSPVTVNVPESEAAEVNVTVSMDQLATSLRETNNLLGQVVNLLGQQVTKTVKRDGNKLIEQVVETRG